jgi:peroxiredoxin
MYLGYPIKISSTTMKKIATFLFCLLPLMLLAQKNKALRFQIEGYNAGTARLAGFYGDEYFQADTARIAADGSMVFERVLGYPSGLYFLLLPDKQQVQFLIDSTRQTPIALRSRREQLIAAMQIPADDVDNTLLYQNLAFQSRWQPQMEAAQRDLNQIPMQTADNRWSVAKQKVETLERELEQHLEPLRTTYRNTFFAAFKLAGQNPKIPYNPQPQNIAYSNALRNEYRSHFWDGTTFGDGRLLATPVMVNKVRRYIKELTPQLPDSINAAADWLIEKIQAERGDKEIFKFVVNYIALQYKPARTSLMDGEAVYSHLILKYFTPELAFWSNTKELDNLRNEAQKMRPSIVGAIGQDVQGYNASGQAQRLYDLKAKVKILFIYNPDCEHCQEETPKLRAFYELWRSRGVEIFSIASMASDVAQWQNFAKKYGVNWTDVVDFKLESRYNDKYFIDITPEIYVLDTNNRIVAKNLKASQLEEVIAPMVK